MVPNCSHTTVSSKHLRYVGVSLAVLLFSGMARALPVVTDIGIVAGERGIAVTFSADVPFDAVFAGNNKTVSATLKGCIYGLPEFTYENFPDVSPVRSITAVEGKNASVLITIAMKQIAAFPVKSVQKGNQWIALLSALPSGPFTWNAGALDKIPSASSVRPDETAPVEKVPSGPARLQNVRMLQRGLVSELAFEFDVDVTGNLQRSGNRITLSVDRAVNAIGEKNFKLPAPAPFKSVSLVEHVHQNAAGELDATVVIDTAYIESDFNVAFTRGKVISLFIVNRNNRKAMLWTSGHGLSWNYELYDVPSYRVDLASMNKRAIRDANEVLSRKGTFAVREAARVEQPSVPDAAATQPPPVVEIPSTNPVVKSSEIPPSESVDMGSMAVISDQVNLRSLPSKKGRVQTLLSRGETVMVTGKKNSWYKVEAGSRTGYVAEQFLGSVAGMDTPPGAGTSAESFSTATAIIEPAGSITKVAAQTSSSFATTVPEGSVAATVAPADTVNTTPEGAPGLRRTVRYQAVGRDPFAPMSHGEGTLSGLPRVVNLTLVGVLYDDNDHIALFEDRLNGNKPFSFRENDQVDKGKVLKIYQDKVVFLITEFGISRSYTLEIARATQDREAGNK